MDIQSSLDMIEELNEKREISHIVFICVGRDGTDHILGVAGEDDVNVIDMETLMELQTQQLTAIKEGNADGGTYQLDLFGTELS